MPDSERSRASTPEGEETLRLLLRATAKETGTDFFRALVRNLAQALEVDGAWVTEFLPERRRLRSLAFWLKGDFVSHYEYTIDGTPCQPVVEDRCLTHIPDRIVELFPGDNELRTFHAVSYMGVPLLDAEGSVLGHLGVIDSKPMPRRSEMIGLFELFGERAAAEHRRLKAEQALRDREELLARLLQSAMDAIVVLDREMTVRRANDAAERLFSARQGKLIGASVFTFFDPASQDRLKRAAGMLRTLPAPEQRLWIPELLEPPEEASHSFHAEATISSFETREGRRYTLILRDANDRLEAQRRIEELSQEAEYLRAEVREVAEAGAMLGHSPCMMRTYDAVARVAPGDTTVLIHGETGTGKELVARAIHRSSPRRDRPLIRVNCAAIPQNLMESEFFGHEKGAFTGATQRREGRFSLAHRGTIFLDEIGELPIDLQAKLLRVLQEGEFEPLGSVRTIKVDVRVIAATNRDLARMVKEGDFREDLYYRLSVFPIEIPPLRERGNDVLTLAADFAQRFSRQMCRHIDPLGPDDMRLLRGYSWPGNVRELQNVIERAIILGQGDRLDLLRAMPSGSTPPASDPGISNGAPSDSEERVLTDAELRALEKGNIERALLAAGGKISGRDGAARRLGIPPSTLSSRMKALGIDRGRLA